MQITAYRYFLAVADSGSIRQAAEELHVSASAISRQIHNLEHSFATALFDRRPSGMFLTEEGKILAAHMRHTVREMALARAEMDALHGLLTGTIRFAASEGVMAPWVLPAIAAFRAQHPGITFDGEILDAQAIYDAVVADKVDIGIAIFKPLEHPDINIIETFPTPFKIAMATNHPLAGKRRIALEILTRYPLILLGKTFHTHQVLQKACRARDLNLHIALLLNHIDQLKDYVMENQGITLLPEYAILGEQAAGRLAVADLDCPDFPSAQTILCIRKDRQMSKGAQHFLHTLQKLRPESGAALQKDGETYFLKK